MSLQNFIARQLPAISANWLNQIDAFLIGTGVKSPYARTDAEISAGVVPSNFAYPPGHATRYGFLETETGTNNVAAINRAFASLPFIASGIRGGKVKMPGGIYNIIEIIIPRFSQLDGVWLGGTSLMYTGTSWAVSIGSATANNVNKPDCGFSNARVYLGTVSANGVRFQETSHSLLRNVYIEGYVATITPRTNIGVAVDGGSGTAGCYINYIQNVVCNHVNVGLRFLTSGGQRSTSTFITNLSVNGDDAVYGASRGVIIDSGQADGSTWDGGNIEHCSIAIAPAAGSLSLKYSGIRFESNGTDVTSSGGGQQSSSFIGLNTDTQYNVSDANQIYHWIGCTTTSSGPQVSRFASGIKVPLAAIIYDHTAMAPNLLLTNEFVTTITDNFAFIFNAPTNAVNASGHCLRVTFRNASGGALGAPVFNAVYKMAAFGAGPANGFSMTIEWRFDGTNWVEVARSGTTIPN